MSNVESLNEFLDQNPLDVDFARTAVVFSVVDARGGVSGPNMNIIIEAVRLISTPTIIQNPVYEKLVMCWLRSR